MITEIKAAVDHLAGLLVEAVDATGFQTELQASLEARFAGLWFPNDPNRASASRAILWHSHGGGEGIDEGVREVCMANCKGIDSSVDFFTSPFTLWIDPACVAIRLGHGPGIYLPNSAAPSLAVKVIYGAHAIHQPGSMSQPPLPLPPPVLTVSPSTPMLESTGNSWSEQCYPVLSFTHARTPSVSSMASSGYTGSRSHSWGSSYTSSTDDSDQCPSLTATSMHDSDSELSMEDMIDSGCYKNFDIIDDDDDEINVGDETVTEELQESGDVTVCAQDDMASAAAPPTLTITNYDGGNVGVLGGGIRLGAASHKVPKSASTPTRANPHAAPYYPSQATSTMGHFAPPLPPPNSIHSFERSLGFPVPGQFMTMDPYGNNGTATKRVRSRGRRSRGRGAGRAARRQAAAMQALSDADQNLQSHVDGAARAPPTDLCEDERIMAMVRQRADQVAKDLVRRQLDQERQKAQMHYHSSTPPFNQPIQSFQHHPLHQQSHQPYLQWA